MKAILISIKPKYVAKILNGEKTIEIRKTMPKCDLPIDVYIYCSKFQNGYTNRLIKLKNGKFHYLESLDDVMATLDDVVETGLTGKVVAKFTLNKVESCPCIDQLNPNKAEQTCVDWIELGKYTKNKRFYLWHITNLVIFDKPKELSEFGVKCSPQSYQYIEIE